MNATIGVPDRVVHQSDHLSKDLVDPKTVAENIARIANAVQCYSLLSGHYDCHDLSFSIV